VKVNPHLIIFFDFVKNPSQDSTYLSSKEKFRKLLIYYFIYFIGSLCADLFLELLKHLHLLEINDNVIVKSILDNTVLERYILYVFLGPFIEEFIFRYPLKYFQTRIWYRFYVYLSALLFGLIHFSNFTSSPNAIYYIIFITAPQILCGLILSYVRINYGFWYSLLMHSCINFIAISLISMHI